MSAAAGDQDQVMRLSDLASSAPALTAAALALALGSVDDGRLVLCPERAPAAGQPDRGAACVVAGTACSATWVKLASGTSRADGHI
ncbi:MAG TPA: hypothetical protein VMV92_35400 [Streptosporangiaceae bacterium]|nr:hypothetical protein [Streptosporangiaceae bacterium]